MKKLLLHTSAVAATWLSTLARPAFAQTLPALEPATGTGNETTIIGIIQSVVDWLFILAGALAVAYLVWGGIQYITGGAEGSKAAKGTIINAIIGVVIIVLSYVIVNAVVSLLN